MKNKEIEELLNTFKELINTYSPDTEPFTIDYDYEIKYSALESLLSYIEQLQTTANECKRDYQRMKDNFDSKVDVITELKEDIEEYNDKLNEIVKERNKLINENKILKENAEHNDKVVDKVNWENQQLKKQKDDVVEYIKNNAEEYKWEDDDGAINKDYCCEGKVILRMLGEIDNEYE